MKIQLQTKDQKVLYEQEQSERFRDYRSVLQNAITIDVDLSGLHVENQQLDGMIWHKINFSSISFTNCSLKKNSFIKCKLDGVYASNCDFTSSKFDRSELTDFHFTKTNLSKLKVEHCSMYNHFYIECSIPQADFNHIKFEHTSFHTTNLSETLFYNCVFLEGSIIHFNTNNSWYKSLCFVGCYFKEVEIQASMNLADMYFDHTNVYDLELEEDERFTEIINKRSRILYAIDSDIIWWKPYSWNSTNREIYRSNLKQFQEEVNNGFPTTDLFPDMTDYEIEIELLHVIEYLLSWNKK